MKLHYNWYLKDYPKEKNGYKVFSTFACGGGSTMGYKLAGYDVLGFNEIDNRMAELYIKNHNPKYSYVEDIRDFKNRNDFPEELYNLDILDGSPPCSTFSLSGNREEDWGKKKKFKEGQKEQVLDTLFFDFIDLGKKLRPKVMIAENVKGLMQGTALDYMHRIQRAFDEAGYVVKYWLLNASHMGVPQRRERVFFIAIRKDLKIDSESVDLFEYYPHIDMTFNEPPVLFKEIYHPNVDDRPTKIKEKGLMYQYWLTRQPTDKNFADTIMRTHNKHRCFNNYYVHNNLVCSTMTSNSDCLYLYEEFRKPNKVEACRISTFPQDYDFGKQQYYYVVGMSVPPIMAARVANRVQKYILDKIIA